jgi:hypothetical protein
MKLLYSFMMALGIVIALVILVFGLGILVVWFPVWGGAIAVSIVVTAALTGVIYNLKQ